MLKAIQWPEDQNETWCRIFNEWNRISYIWTCHIYHRQFCNFTFSKKSFYFSYLLLLKSLQMKLLMLLTRKENRFISCSKTPRDLKTVNISKIWNSWTETPPKLFLSTATKRHANISLKIRSFSSPGMATLKTKRFLIWLHFWKVIGLKQNLEAWLKGS